MTTLNTNQLFEKQSEFWSCPGCGRRKKEIPRECRGGGKVAKVVEHHDHLKEFTNETVRQAYGSEWNTKVAAGVAPFLNRIERFVVAFDPTAICEDCNNIEAEAKKWVNAPRLFTFTPREIRQFVVAAPNAPHTINVDKTQAVYGEAKKKFEMRLAVARRLLEDALKSGIFWP